MDETTKLALQITALFVGVIIFMLWVTKPLITKPRERVKQGATEPAVLCLNCENGHMEAIKSIMRCANCQCIVEYHIAPQPQLPPQPELDISPLGTGTLMLHHCNSSAILAAMDVYDDSSNNMVNVGSGLDYFEDVLGNDSISLDEEEVYNALKKVAEAGLDYVFNYVYFYQT